MKAKTNNSFSEVNKSLNTNISNIKSLFVTDNTVKQRNFSTKDGSNDLCLFFVDGLVNDLIINQNILLPIMRSHINPNFDSLKMIVGRILPGNDISETKNLNDAVLSMLTGDTLLFIDGSDSCVVISTKKWSLRSVEEPDSERVSKGPREGFTESLLVNLSLVRRKLPTPELKFEFMQMGKRSHTKCCICYVEGIVKKELLEDFRERLRRIDIDIVLDTNYVEELIKEKHFSPFKTTGTTERPDVVAAKLLEGRVVLIVDGTPCALSAPFLFLEYFRSNDDYYSNYFYASFGRLLRFLGFFLTVSIPAVYLSLVTFHMDMLPTKFLLNLFESRIGIPVSSFFEMIVMILVFELIREGSAKIPSDISGTLSIVGGLVLGQASVEAKFVSLPIVIIVAFTGITGLMTPQLKGPAILLRIAFLISSAFLGIFGYILCVTVLLIYLSSMSSFGIPYLSLQSAGFFQAASDSAIRLPWNYMIRRPDKTSGRDKIRQKPFNIMRNTFLLSSIIILTCLLSGCSGKEIDNLTPIAGLSVDEGNVVCAEKISANSELAGDNASSSIFSEGETLLDAVSSFDDNGNGSLLLSHASLFFVSIKYAETYGINETVNYGMNNSQIRLNTCMLLTDLPQASDVFLLKTGPTNIKSYDIRKSVSDKVGLGKGMMFLYQIADSINMKNNCYTIPIISSSSLGEDKSAVLSGAGIFCEDRLVGRLTSKEADYLSIIKGSCRGRALLINKSLYKIKKCSVKIRENDESDCFVDINIKLSKDISETNTYSGNFTKNSSKDKSEYSSDTLGSFIGRECEELIKHVQKEFGTDIFHIMKQMNQSDREFAEIKVSVKCTASLTSDTILSGK